MGTKEERRRAFRPVPDERGFTLIEVMLGIVLLTFGLLAVADVFPHGLALSLYGKDQTKAADLGQQEIEFLRTQATNASSCPSTPISQTTSAGINCLVGDYGTNVSTSYFDPNGNAVAQSAAYFSRDVQVQYWTWSASAGQFTLPSSPYTTPAHCVQYVYRVSIATHWLVRGQTVFTSGNTGSPNGCVVGGAAAPTGLGCVQVSTFVTPTTPPPCP
jgi:prepilin-type N-terminal cleavage/methylation domain-containing protein